MALLALAACADSGVVAGKAYPPAVLKWRDCLDFVRHGKHEAGFESPCVSDDRTVLLGLSRDDVHALFGKADVCKDTDDDTAWSTKPCWKADQWWYSFYTLPEEVIGGGPELVFDFSRDERVVNVRRFNTQ